MNTGLLGCWSSTIPNTQRCSTNRPQLNYNMQTPIEINIWLKHTSCKRQIFWFQYGDFVDSWSSEYWLNATLRSHKSEICSLRKDVIIKLFPKLGTGLGMMQIVFGVMLPHIATPLAHVHVSCRKHFIITWTQVWPSVCKFKVTHSMDSGVTAVALSTHTHRSAKCQLHFVQKTASCVIEHVAAFGNLQKL